MPLSLDPSRQNPLPEFLLKFPRPQPGDLRRDPQPATLTIQSLIPSCAPRNLTRSDALAPAVQDLEAFLARPPEKANAVHHTLRLRAHLFSRAFPQVPP